MMTYDSKMKKLTIERLEEMKPGEAINFGIAVNEPGGIYLTDSRVGDEIIWVACRGKGAPDWAIYAHWKFETPGRSLESPIDWIKTHGQKIYDRTNVEKLLGKLPDDVWERYRKIHYQG